MTVLDPVRHAQYGVRHGAEVAGPVVDAVLLPEALEAGLEGGEGAVGEGVEAGAVVEFAEGVQMGVGEGEAEGVGFLGGVEEVVEVGFEAGCGGGVFTSFV